MKTHFLLIPALLAITLALGTGNQSLEGLANQIKLEVLPALSVIYSTLASHIEDKVLTEIR